MICANESIKKRSLRICDCGIANYRRILEFQRQLWQQRYEGKIPNTVLIVEHEPVITLGARKNANVLFESIEDLTSKQIDVVEVRRGGGTTAHNPGQLVFYPIMNLQQIGLGINEYIRELETIGIELLWSLGVRSQRLNRLPGVWIGLKKIASIGVRVSKAVTYHGMAINIQNDLDIFDFFVPCGLERVEITSVIKETGKRQSMSLVKKELGRLLTEHFSSEDSTEYESFE